MHAHPGDKLVISGHQIGEPKRVGRVKEIRGPEAAALADPADVLSAQITLPHARDEPGLPAVVNA